MLTSSRLTYDQQLAARVLAAALGTSGAAFVLVSMTDVLAALHDAA